jgi:hypothetical protein
VTQKVFDDPAAENASRGLRIASTMAQIAITIAAKETTNPTIIDMAAPAEYLIAQLSILAGL